MKYIVYITTNLINKHIYIGVHQVENLEVFDGYLGCGVNRFSPSTIRHPKTPFQHAVKKYGFDAFYRKTIKVFNSQEEAFEFERILVDEEFIKRNDTYNISLGGNIPPNSGIKCYQYSLSGEFIKEWESILQATSFYSNSRGGNIYDSIKYGLTSYDSLWTTYKVHKIDIQNFNVYNPKKQIYLYNNDLSYCKTFASISECSKYLDVSLAQVQRAVKLLTKVRNYYVSDVLQDTLVKVSQRITGNVHQYSLSGEYIASYETIKDAEKALKTNLQRMNTSIKLGHAYKGYIWRRGDKLTSVTPQTPKDLNSRRVGQYTKQGELVQIFNTVREARQKFPNVSKVLKGTATHCHNFIFKYIE